MEAEVFEELMDAEVALEDEDAPSVSAWVFLAEEAEGLEVSVAHVVHPPVDLADVDPEDGQLVAVQGVLQETQVNLHFKLCLEDYSHIDEVFAALP